MITHFYKILYENKDVVYVGVTTRTINKRFQEHVSLKKLNQHYSVVEFDKIEHPKIDCLKTYYEECCKVSNLERKYIREEKLKGSKLLNISLGGEWGTTILNKLYRKDFFEKFGTYDNYIKYRKK